MNPQPAHRLYSFTIHPGEDNAAPHGVTYDCYANNRRSAAKRLARYVRQAFKGKRLATNHACFVTPSTVVPHPLPVNAPATAPNQPKARP